MSSPFAIVNTTIVDPTGNGKLIAGQTVLVDRAGKIEKIDPAHEVRVPAEYKAADGRGKYLTAGLINVHVHLFADGTPLPKAFTSPGLEKIASTVLHSAVGKQVALARTRKNLRTQLLSGVTTVRSLGDVEFEVVRVADQIEAGQLDGPRVLASGPMLSTTGGHGVPMVARAGDGPWEMRSLVRRNLRGGASTIKVSSTGGVTDARSVGEAGRPQLTVEEMTAVCDEAHAAGMLVAAHAQSTEGVLRALRAGVDTIEHGASMSDEVAELFLDNPRSLHGWSALIPTLNAAIPLAELGQEITGVSDVVRQNSQLILAEMVQGMRDAQKYGVTMGIGNDASMAFVTQYGTWRELDFVASFAGMSNAQVLNAATAVNAKILGLEGVTGEIREGLDADLVLVDDNPLDDFATFAAPDLVVARGRTYIRPRIETFEELDSYLDELRR